MSVKLVPEEDLRAALRPYRPDVHGFEAGVRERIEAGAESHEDEDFGEQSSLLRVAAAFLPWPLIAGGKIAGSGAKLSSMALGQKLLGYAALPAISLFLLAGAALFGATKIRSIQKENRPDASNQKEMHEAIRRWWRRHKWVAVAVFAAVFGLPMIGSTWLMLLLLLVSFGSLLCLLSGFAKLGVGNRLMIGQSCLMGLVFLSQAMLNPFVGLRDIHFVDQKLITAVFFVGTLILLPLLIGSARRMGVSGPTIAMEGKASLWYILLCVGSIVFAGMLVAVLLLARPGLDHPPVGADYQWLLLPALIVVEVVFLITMTVLIARSAARSRKAGASRFGAGPLWIGGLLFVSIVVPLIAWLTNPIWWPATPARIQHYVESFEEGRFPFIAWRDWEIAASWSIDAGLDPDLSRARRLLADEISGEQHPLVLGSAFRVDLVRTDQIERLAGLEERRQFLIPKHGALRSRGISSLNQRAWLIHALNESGQLSPEDRDFLQQRLLATFDGLDDATADVLETALRVTQLLDVIDRPIDPDQYRERVHEWLREFHSKSTHGHLIAGGFQQYKGVASSLEATSHAIELMEIYGAADDLDLNWVRSYVRPLSYRPSNRRWIAAVTLDRLNRLPGVTQPTWPEILYYERSLIAAMVLVALCIYATLSSPIPAVDASSNHDDAGNDAS